MERMARGARNGSEKDAHPENRGRIGKQAGREKPEPEHSPFSAKQLLAMAAIVLAAASFSKCGSALKFKGDISEDTQQDTPAEIADAPDETPDLPPEVEDVPDFDSLPDLTDMVEEDVDEDDGGLPPEPTYDRLSLDRESRTMFTFTDGFGEVCYTETEGLYLLETRDSEFTLSGGYAGAGTRSGSRAFIIYEFAMPPTSCTGLEPINGSVVLETPGGTTYFYQYPETGGPLEISYPWAGENSHILIYNRADAPHGDEAHKGEVQVYLVGPVGQHEIEEGVFVDIVEALGVKIHEYGYLFSIFEDMEGNAELFIMDEWHATDAGTTIAFDFHGYTSGEDYGQGFISPRGTEFRVGSMSTAVFFVPDYSQWWKVVGLDLCWDETSHRLDPC